MPWTIQEETLTGVTTTTVPSGSSATLGSTFVFLELDDTNGGGLNYRILNLNKIWQIQWNNSGTWTTLYETTDPTATTSWFLLNSIGLWINNLAVGPNLVFKQIVGSEANPRYQWDTNGLISWGPGGGTAVDTTLQRVAAGILSTGQIRATTGAPSNIADLTRKDYVDTQVATRVNKAGDTMTGLLILSGDPTNVLGAATKQYVDNKIPTGGALGGGPFTAGSVIFSSGGTTLSQDNANFFWDSTNHRLGLGNAAPGTLLDIANSTITLRQTSGNYSLTWANPAAARAISIPDPGGTDVFVFAAMMQTLSNKTLTKPVLTSASRTGQTATFGATVTIDLNLGDQVFITYTSSFTLAAPLNPITGQILTIKFIHDATATAYTITWNAVFKRAGGAYTNTNAANAVDTIAFQYDGTNWNEIGRALNLS